MAVKFKAIPTEYRGIRFDSKSEAVFARLLDLHGIDWEHQHPISHEGHDWDFLLWLPDYTSFTAFPNGYDVDEGCSTSARESVRPCLIELKPSEPTDTYLLRLEKGHGSPQNEMRIVAWGNPWEGGVRNATYECKELIWNKTWNPGRLSWVNGFCGFDSSDRIDEAKSYRFDLAHQVEVLSGKYAQDAINNHRLAKEKKENERLKTEKMWRNLVGVETLELCELDQWRKALRLIDDMVADYAGLAVAVIPDGTDHWNVVFPPGASLVREACEQPHRRSTLEHALAKVLKRTVRLSFSSSQTKQPEDIKLIAGKDEPSRIVRLQKVVEYIKNACPQILERISSLEDHKGELTCLWVPQCRRVGNGKTTVENAWESVGECASNVTHEYL